MADKEGPGDDYLLDRAVTSAIVIDQQNREIERLRGEVLALHAVIHMTWIETDNGTTPMPDDVRAAILRALVAHEQKDT